MLWHVEELDYGFYAICNQMWVALATVRISETETTGQYKVTV